MSKWERLAVAVLVGLMMLWVGAVDYGDPTPAVIRWPIGLAASVGLAWVVWHWSGRANRVTHYVKLYYVKVLCQGIGICLFRMSVL